MNKTELIDKVAADAGLTKAQSGDAVTAVLNAIQDALKGGDSVVLVGFGAFSVVERASRTGRNPRTGDTITIPEVRMPRFKPGKALKDAVARVKEAAKAAPAAKAAAAPAPAPAVKAAPAAKAAVAAPAAAKAAPAKAAPAAKAVAPAAAPAAAPKGKVKK